mgnify:FL=1
MQKNSKKIAKKIFYGRTPVLEKPQRYTPATPFVTRWKSSIYMCKMNVLHSNALKYYDK